MSATPVSVLLTLAFGLVSCNGADTAGPAATSAAPSHGAPTVSGSPSPGPEATPADADRPLLPWLPDGRVLALTTPTSGVGQRPVLAWEGLEGATVYSAVVYDADGTPYWAWETEDTQVRVGLTDRPEQAPGPRLADGMTWAVVAYDVDGLPIGSSPLRPIAP